MRLLSVLTLFLAGCGLTRYREDRDSLLRELRETKIGPYFANVSDTLTPVPAPEELEKVVQGDGFSVEQAVGYALARNPELVSTLSHWEMLLERVPQASITARSGR